MPCRTDDYSSPSCPPPKPDIVPLLCSACRSLEKLGFEFATNPELDNWWHNHEEADAKRRLAEAKEKLSREEAIRIANTKTLAQLTADDKKLLRKHGVL